MIICILGPTGVGKTKLSIELAKKYNAEIINADSVQVYKGLDIGSAKIKDEEMDNIPHHLLSYVDVTYDYTLFDYQKDGRKVLNNLLNNNKNVIIVGGTGLYIKALLYDYKLIEGDNSKDIDLSNEELISFIKDNKPDLEIDFNNRRRLVRAYQKIVNNEEFDNNSKLLYDTLFIGLTTDRDNLYNIIDSRVEDMFNEGLLNEVKSFYDKGINSKVLTSAIGYKEVYSYLRGEITLDECKSLIKKNSRHYAKRQYTFFNHQIDNIRWFNTNYDDFNKTIEEVNNYINKSSH